MFPAWAIPPPSAVNRSRCDHRAVVTVLGDNQSGSCVVTLVERKTGSLARGLFARRVAPKPRVDRAIW